MAGRERHELACSSCGAPLHNLKMLPKSSKGDRALVRNSASQGGYPAKRKPVKKKKTKSRLSRWGDLFEDAFDIIEDILD